jgi:hypothetical protein
MKMDMSTPLLLMLLEILLPQLKHLMQAQPPLLGTLMEIQLPHTKILMESPLSQSLMPTVEKLPML